MPIWASLTRCAEQRGRFSFILFQYGRFGPLQQMVYTKPWGWNYMASQRCALIQVCDITKVCTGPRVRYYKSVHWSKCVHQSFWNLDISMRYTDSGIWTSSFVDDYDHTGPAWYDTIRRVYSDLQRAMPFLYAAWEAVRESTTSTWTNLHITNGWRCHLQCRIHVSLKCGVSSSLNAKTNVIAVVERSKSRVGCDAHILTNAEDE